MNNMKINRGGWLRIVEATIGVILILGSVLIYYQKNSSDAGENFGDSLPILADEIAKNNTLRGEIINVNLDNAGEVNIVKMKVNDFLSLRIGRSDLNHTVEICNATADCKLTADTSNSDGNLYGYERIISTNINSSKFNPETTPKKIKLYIWKIK
ncbi:MAG: hypothetical protein AABX85_00170 [Nanoarchaeota archaeon]